MEEIMRNSKVFRAICYILLPILITILIFSSVYIFLVNDSEYTSEKAFFEGYRFKSAYCNEIIDFMDTLIFAQDEYRSVQDGDITIYNAGNSYMFGRDNFMDFLIIYGNKAITNIKFTDTINTIETIKAKVLENNKNNLCYENQKIVSNVENYVDDSYIYNRLDSVEITYYTRDNKVSRDYDDMEVEEEIEKTSELTAIEETPNPAVVTTPEPVSTENPVLANPEIQSDSTSMTTDNIQPDNTDITADNVQQGNTNTITDNSQVNIDYHTAYLQDFTIYTSYNPSIDEYTEIKMVINLLEAMEPYQKSITIAVPVSAILILLIIIFLVNSMGHVKDKEEIQLTDFDRIPFEVILLIWGIVAGISIGVLEEVPWDSYTSIDAIISILSTLYIVNVIISEAVIITFIVRLKGKKFLETCWCGKLVKWVWNLCKKIINKAFELLRKTKDLMKKAKNSLNENVGLTWKLVIAICVYAIICTVLLAILGPFGAIIDLVVFIYIIYQIIVRINSFKKMEEALKKIYDGEKVTLYSDDFSSEFNKCVEYINDISNGFENAVEESLKSERMKTELITNVSHDIKTPLTSIINYVDLIKKENVDNEKIKEYIEILDNKSQRLKKLTEDLVEASKASSGNLSLNLEDIGIVELLNQTMGEYKDKFEEKKLEVVSNISKGNIKIKADSRYIYRVVDNLFGNISKYALDNSRVYVETEVKDEKVKIILKNISKDRLNITEEELMQRFVRGDKSRTTEGSGLGLAIARSLTELQGGTLNCKIDGDLFKVEIEFKTI